MGLDIHIGTDNYNEIFSPDYFDKETGYLSKHRLSRTFCNFMCRQNVVSHESELEQIGTITGIDISPLYEMENYPDPETIEFFLEKANSEEERQSILTKTEANKEKLKGNIDLVKQTIDNLIKKLNSIPNLANLLKQTDFDTLDNQMYFSNFQTDKGQGYIDNNFGQDLRNFSRFLEYAKSKGSSTVWFNYG